jgi:preprotein translocase subunit SecG
VPIVKSILVIIEIITCLLLVVIILIQKTKSQGAGMAFGAAMGESLFGAQTGNVLTKATVILTIVFLIDTTLLTLLTPRMGRSVTDTVPAPARSATMPQTARPVQAPADAMPDTPATMPAPVAGAAGQADQPMQPDAAASLPVQPKDTGTGTQPSK